MSQRRRRSPEDSPVTPKEQLWLAVRDAFEDDGTWHASSEAGFDDLSGSDILRVWDHIHSRATAITQSAIWDRKHEPVGESLALGVAVTRLARGELGYISVTVDGLVPRRIPPFELELWQDGVQLYWWVGVDGWDAETVAELAQLLGEFHARVPRARLTYEEPGVDFFGARSRDIWPPRDSCVAISPRSASGDIVRSCNVAAS